MVCRPPNPDLYLEPTEFIDSNHVWILDCVSRLGASYLDVKDRAILLFRFVRDQIQYNFRARSTPKEYIASSILAKRKGFCVQKAILSCALGRAAGVPTALVFSDLRDHTLSPEIVQALGTYVMYYHGLNAFFLDGGWVMADASLSPDIVVRKGYRPVDFDGTTDALLSSTTLAGEPHAEYVRFHGIFLDLPFEEMLQAFMDAYRNVDPQALERLGYQWCSQESTRFLEVVKKGRMPS